MTDQSKFRVGNIGHTCYFAVGARLSNFRFFISLGLSGYLHF